MKTTGLVLLSCLLAPLAGRLQSQDGQEPPAPQKKRPGAITRSFAKAGDDLTQAVEGSWMLFDYTDPSDLERADLAAGFATFHDGFLTLMMSMDTYDRRMFRMHPRLVLDAGAYRFRFDEQSNLQLSNVISFTNQTQDGTMEREQNGQAYEYNVTLDDEELQMRDAEGVTYHFRRINAGEFPQSAVKKLESRRSGTPQWEKAGGDQPK